MSYRIRDIRSESLEELFEFSPRSERARTERCMEVNYYDFKVRYPIYDTNILNITNVVEKDADFTLHENLERMILETGDEMKKSTNVKADMTNWTMHKTHTGFKKLSDIVCSIASQMTKTKPPLYTSECWGAAYGKGESTQAHNHWPYLWSWCYYVKTPKGSSPLVFPESGMCFEPNEGDVIIFSSMAKHYVPACDCEEKRIMIAGNIGVKEI